MRKASRAALDATATSNCGQPRAYVGLLEVALLLTAVFAVAGVVIGTMRGLRSGGAIKPRRA